MESKMKSIAKFLLKYINVKPMLIALIDEKLEAELDKIVKSTENTLDDSFKTMFYPIIEQYALAAIESMDVEELLGLNEPEKK